MAVDLLEAAETEAARETCSVREQLDHWTRLGMHVSMRSTAARRRTENVVRGDLSQLTTEEREVANVELSVTTCEEANRMSFADRLAAEGVTTVTLDAEGAAGRAPARRDHHGSVSRLDLVARAKQAGYDVHVHVLLATEDQVVPPSPPAGRRRRS